MARRFLYQSIAFVARAAPAVLVASAVSPVQPPVKARAVPAALQQFSSWQAFSLVGNFVQAPETFALTRQVSAAQQPFDSWPQYPRGVDPPNTTNWRQQPLNPEIFSKPFPVASQQFDQQPIPYPGNTSPWRQQPLNPEVFKPPFPVTSQLYVPPFWQGNVPTDPNSFRSGWWGQQLEYRFAKPFPVASQPFPPDFQARGTIFTSFPDGWRAHQFDYAFKPRFPVNEQPFPSDFQAQGIIRSVFPDGWRHEELSYAFKPRFPAALQQYLTHDPQDVRLASDVQGWFHEEWSYRYKPQFPVRAQVWSSHQPRGFIILVFPDGFRHEEWVYRFAKPVPATLQQYSGQGLWEVPYYPPTGAGKRKNFPSYIPQPPVDTKPNKPFRPVWDKPRVIPSDEPPPPTEIPLPPPSLFGQAEPPPAGPLNLPDFKNLLPPDPAGFDQHMREVQDLSDAMAVLKALGLITEQ